MSETGGPNHPGGRSRASPGDRPARHAVLPSGVLVGGRYRVAGVIGEGSHSVVYAAYREPRGEEVALKIIHRHLCGDPQISRRFEREASILRRLEGEHVARLLDFVDEDGLLALALERVDGSSLEAMLAQRAPLPLDVAIEISLQVCAALGAAHANGIVHRDLKTANVLVERAAAGAAGAPPPDPQRSAGAIRVKVVDFGLSKVLQGDPNIGLTEQGMIFGTPAYMAPEQARGDEVDARADLYAAGVMLYEMAVGAPPFAGRSALDTMSAHLTEAPLAPRVARPGSSITPSLEAVILRALAKSPADRFASASELAHAIAAARDEPLVIAPRAVPNPDELAVGDTDLHIESFDGGAAGGPAPLAPDEVSSLGQARTLRADEVAAQARSLREAPRVVAAGGAPHGGAASGPIPRAPGEPSPRPGPGSGLVWAVVAVVAAAVGVVIGVLVGTR